MGQIDRTAFTALVDDDGSNTTGTIWNKTQIQSVILDPVDNALGQTQLTIVTGAQANFALTTGARLLRVNNASDVTFSGFSAGVDDQILIVKPIGAGNVFVKHLSGLSSAANQCSNMATSGDTPIAAGGAAFYVYDGTSSLWRLVAHEQGAWITPTFAAGNFTANNSMTWTVGGGAVAVNRFRLTGRTLAYAYDIGVTTIGGSVSTALQIDHGAWGGFSAAVAGNGAFAFVNGGGVVGNGVARVAGGGTSMSLFVDRSVATNWTLGASAIVSGLFTIEIQ